MSLRTTFASLFVFLFTLTGCIPEKKIVWSPDGRRAAVIGGDGLYLCDENGKLSSKLAADVTDVAWLPDSRKLVVVRAEKLQDWKRVAEVLPEARCKGLIEQSTRLKREMLEHRGDWKNFYDKDIAKLGASAGEIFAMLVYLDEHNRAGLTEALGKEWEKFRKDDDMGFLQFIEIVEPDTPTKDAHPLLHVCLNRAGRPVVSPNGKWVAFVEWPLPKKPLLKVAATAGGDNPMKVVSEGVGFHTAWSPDSRQLAYFQSLNPTQEDSDDTELGRVLVHTVVHVDQTLWERPPDPVYLADVVFDGWGGIGWLSENRVLFSAHDTQLPAAPGNLTQRCNLYWVNTNGGGEIQRLIETKERNEPDEERDELSQCSSFQISPDRNQVLIPGYKGCVGVYSIDTKNWKLLGGEAPSELQSLPSWRSNEEVCYLRPADGGPEKVVLHHLGSDGSPDRVISDQWPEAVAEGLLFERKQAAP